MIRISGSCFGLSVSTLPTQRSYLYLPDGKMATIRLTRMALEPAGSTPYHGQATRGARTMTFRIVSAKEMDVACAYRTTVMVQSVQRVSTACVLTAV